MDRDEILSRLRTHAPELRRSGVVHLSIFGSLARGESRPADVDIAVQLNEDFSAGGFDYFLRLEELERHLSHLLGCDVDIVEEPVRKARVQQEIERDRAIAF